MKTKIGMLKKYVERQAFDHGLWQDHDEVSKAYLQQELRRITWMIEDATIQQITDEIKRYDVR
ncbi:MAG TPA: hypothetical protein VGJ00_10510 [Rhabdochlamydiaceae bacterium]